MRTWNKKAKNAEKKSDIVVEVDVAKIARLSVTIVMSVVVLFFIFTFIRSFLPVTKFEVDGVMTYKIYDTADFLSAAEVKRGDRLYRIDLDEAEKKIVEECAYIESVELKRKFPNKLLICVEEKLPHWYIELAGKYYALDSDLKIIEENNSNENYISAGVTKLVLPNIERAVVDELPSFGESELEIKKTIETVSSIRETALKTRITGVDLKSRFNIYLELDHNKQVYLGDAENMDYKLHALEAFVNSLEQGTEKIAYIDASNPASISSGMYPHGN